MSEEVIKQLQIDSASLEYRVVVLEETLVRFFTALEAAYGAEHSRIAIVALDGHDMAEPWASTAEYYLDRLHELSGHEGLHQRGVKKQSASDVTVPAGTGQNGQEFAVDWHRNYRDALLLPETTS